MRAQGARKTSQAKRLEAENRDENTTGPYCRSGALFHLVILYECGAFTTSLPFISRLLRSLNAYLSSRDSQILSASSWCVYGPGCTQSESLVLSVAGRDEASAQFVNLSRDTIDGRYL
jgi:hypothetical protein